MTDRFSHAVVLGAAGAIGQALTGQLVSQFPAAKVHAFSLSKKSTYAYPIIFKFLLTEAIFSLMNWIFLIFHIATVLIFTTFIKQFTF